MYVRQLIYYGVSPPRKNASVFYGDKSSLKHFASIDLSGNKKSKDGQKSFPRLMILFCFPVFPSFYFLLTMETRTIAYDRELSSSFLPEFREFLRDRFPR